MAGLSAAQDRFVLQSKKGERVAGLLRKGIGPPPPPGHAQPASRPQVWRLSPPPRYSPSSACRSWSRREGGGSCRVLLPFALRLWSEDHVPRRRLAEEQVDFSFLPSGRQEHGGTPEPLMTHGPSAGQELGLFGDERNLQQAQHSLEAAVPT